MQPHLTTENIIQIPLTRGMFALIDDIDYEFISQYTWRAILNRNTWYAITGGRRLKLTWMHRILLNAPNGVIVDHKDLDGLNNRRNNIRLATGAQNRQNAGLMSRNKSGYKGVSATKGGKWQVHIADKNNHIYLGLFTDIIEAALAYDTAARELFGEFARTNF